MFFICVNYNSYGESLKYIDNVLTFGQGVSVIIVDNSPSEESYSILMQYVSKKQVQDQVHVLRVENRGYFQGLNEGILFAKENFDSYNSFFIVGNNDILFREDFVSNLKIIKLHNEDLILAPDVITTDGSHENPHVIHKMSFLRKWKYKIYFSNYQIANILSKLKNPNKRSFKVYDPKRKKIYMGIGALYVLTPNFFTYFDKLTEEVFLYGEEAVLAGQIESVRGNIIYEPRLVCYHNESSTTSKMETRSKYEIIRKSYNIYKKYL